ncbi:hypothetical protein BFJ69_g17145 [Fusarium oxysporum]|uniref:Uncharacterized protein n=2 Tax=Fusarium oxysporum TaxID=5507 RepID=A0A420M940_FUSOX|nr:hypothetical protein BFJ65_g18581 [Fusarium oxysporum f. sp. cepae]RKK61226.1 hypothetical protein BFJ69_g17145 [Fusarium oxysporum]
MPTDIATRALVVTLKAPAGAAKTTAEIEEITGIPYRTINAIYARAIRQGFEPNERPLRLQDAWLQNAPRSGRPTKQTKETKELIFAKPGGDRYQQGDGDVHTQSCRLQENEADEEAWTDDEDEEGTTGMVSCPPKLDPRRLEVSNLV